MRTPPSPVEGCCSTGEGLGMGVGFNHASRNCTNSRAASAMARSRCRGEAFANDLRPTEMPDVAALPIDGDSPPNASPLLGSCPGGHGNGKVSKQEMIL